MAGEERIEVKQLDYETWYEEGQTHEKAMLFDVHHPHKVWDGLMLSSFCTESQLYGHLWLLPWGVPQKRGPAIFNSRQFDQINHLDEVRYASLHILDYSRIQTDSLSGHRHTLTRRVSPETAMAAIKSTPRISGEPHEARIRTKSTHCAVIHVQIHKLLYSCVLPNEIHTKQISPFTNTKNSQSNSRHI